MPAWGKMDLWARRNSSFAVYPLAIRISFIRPVPLRCANMPRHARIAERVSGRISDAGEEILASVLGSLICEEEADRDNLTVKAAAALVDHGEAPETAFLRVDELRKLFGELL